MDPLESFPETALLEADLVVYFQASSLNGNDSICYARMVFMEQKWLNQILSQHQISIKS